MRGSEFERELIAAGLARKQASDLLGISQATISRLISYPGLIPKRHTLALRYALECGGDDPILEPRDILGMWAGPRKRLAYTIGLTPEYMSNLVCGVHPISKTVSMAIRQAVREREAREEKEFA